MGGTRIPCRPHNRSTRFAVHRPALRDQQDAWILQIPTTRMRCSVDVHRRHQAVPRSPAAPPRSEGSSGAARPPGTPVAPRRDDRRCRSRRRPRRAGLTRSRLQILEHADVQSLLRDNAFEAGVLLLQCPQPVGLVLLQRPVLLTATDRTSATRITRLSLQTAGIVAPCPCSFSASRELGHDLLSRVPLTRHDPSYNRSQHSRHSHTNWTEKRGAGQGLTHRFSLARTSRLARKREAGRERTARRLMAILAAGPKSPAIELEVGDRTCGSPIRTGSTSRRAVRPSSTSSTTTSPSATGIVNALRERPCMLHRFPTGVSRREGAPEAAPARRAAMGRDGAGDVPAVRPDRRRAVRHRARQRDLGGADVDGGVPPLELPPGRHREARRVAHRPRPDARLRLRPVRRVAHVAHEVLDELGAVGWPKTSGGKGMHIYVRIEPAYGFTDVRRAALAFAREVERRAPDDVTTTWWRKDRDPERVVRRLQPERPRPHDRRAYRVRGDAEGTVSTPIEWGEIDDVVPRRLHDRHGAGAVRRAGRPPRRHRRSGLRHRRRCSSGPTATSGTAPTARGPRGLTGWWIRFRSPAESMKSGCGSSWRSSPSIPGWTTSRSTGWPSFPRGTTSSKTAPR